jgi:hypothetical protein
MTYLPIAISKTRVCSEAAQPVDRRPSAMDDRDADGADNRRCAFRRPRQWTGA